jgi:DNA-binding beta-propeller fold protein YncE
VNIGKFSLVSALSFGLLVFAVPSFGILANVSAASTTSTCSVGSEPSNLAFNPANNYIYVSFGFTTDTISFVKSMCTVVSSTPAIPGCPFDMAFNPVNQMMYATDGCNNSIVLLKGASVVGTITGAAISNPTAIIFDPSNKLMFVGAQDSMVVINGTTVVKTIALKGFTPTSMAYSSSSKEIFAMTGGGSSIEIIGGSCLCLTDHLTIGNGATGITYDPKNSYVYVSGYDSAISNRTGSVTVISASTHAIVKTIGTGRHTNDVAYSPMTNEVYASNFLPMNGATSVSVIKGLSVVNTLSIKGAPDQLCYNAFNGLMYVSLWNLGKLTTIKI